MEIVEQVKVNRWLRFYERVVALIELLLNSLVVSVGSDREHLSPQAIVLAVRETEDVVGS